MIWHIKIVIIFFVENAVVVLLTKSEVKDFNILLEALSFSLSNLFIVEKQLVLVLL